MWNLLLVKTKNFLRLMSISKQLDSLAATKIEYEDFLKNNEDYTHKYQQIRIESTQSETVSNPFLKTLLSRLI